MQKTSIDLRHNGPHDQPQQVLRARRSLSNRLEITMPFLNDSPENWTPVRIQWQAQKPIVQWAKLGSVNHAEPFFTDSIAQALSQHRSPIEWRNTPLSELEASTRQAPLPTGFIFHLSRCGSTLVAQLLSKLTDTTVISEAPPVDSILRAHMQDPSIPEQQRIAWLRATLNALHLNGTGQRHFFIKFDAWHTLELPLIQRAFPDVPWIFVCRNPEDVMRSHTQRPGSHMVQGLIEPEVYGWNSPMPYMSQADYGASVLTRILESAHDAVLACSNARVLDYAQLPQAVAGTLLPFFNVAPSDKELDRIHRASQLDAKNPAAAFTPASYPALSSLLPEIQQNLWHRYQQLLSLQA